MLLDVDDDVEVARGAALRAGLPSPASLSREPVSTPAGIFTSICFSRSTRPAPLHCSQGVRMTRPAPRHCPHVRATEKKPC